jgi:hypothetical protein
MLYDILRVVFPMYDILERACEVFTSSQALPTYRAPGDLGFAYREII